MRKLAVLLIVAGMVVAIGYHLYLKEFSGSDLGRVRVFDRVSGGWENGWQSAKLRLEPADSPMFIRFKGEILPGIFHLPNTVPLKLELSGPEGPVISGEFALSTGENDDQAGNSLRKLSYTLPQFGIIASGEHVLTTRIMFERDINLSWLDAEFVGNAEPVDERIYVGSLGAVIGGILLFIVSRGGNRGDGPRRPKIKWGRQPKP